MSSGDEEGEEAEDGAPVEGDEQRRPSGLCPRRVLAERGDAALVSGHASAGNKPHVNLLNVLQQGWHLRSDFSFDSLRVRLDLKP